MRNMEDEPPFVHNDQGDRSAAVIQVDLGKHVAAVAICSALCGVCAAISIWAGVTAQISATEYRVELNHRMEMEAKQKVLIDEVEAIKHGHR